jgi:hypothetical protein
MIAASLGLAAPAAARGDYRPGDRFFWGMAAGQVDIADGGNHPSTVVAPEISYWPNDYFGGVMRVGISSHVADWGTLAVGAVPLRYVQPYAGVFLGFISLKEEDGVDAHGHVVLGINAYLGRNLRLFVQWEDPKVAALRIGHAHVDTLIGGIRWSPDFYHSARVANKIDGVWWSMLATFAAWGIAVAAQ